MRFLIAGAAALVVACGGSQSAHRDEGPNPATPLTDRDPSWYAPEPSPTPRTGGPVGISLSGGYHQARSIALRVVEALRDGDEEVLRSLLNDPVVSVYPQIGQHSRPRAQLIETLLENPRRTGLGPDTTVEQLVDVSGMEVSTLSRRSTMESMPSGLRPSDLVVTIPLGPEGQRYLRLLLGWPRQGTMVIRPGPEPIVLAM